jgi:cytochrome P450 family 110
MTTASLPPGPTLPPLVQGLQFAFRALPFFETCQRRYGDCFTVRMPVAMPYVLFTAPAAVREIFTGDDDELRAGEANVVLRPLLGVNSVLFLDGDRHARERRLMLPPFHGERMLAYADAMRAITDDALDGWPVGRPFPVHPEMQAITLEIILQTVFGLEAGTLAVLRDLLRRWIASALNPALLWPRLQVDFGRVSPWGRIVRLKREIDALLLAEIARRREAGAGERADVLSLLLAARDEDGRPMRGGELLDEMITLLVAGHETTATALAWTFHHLLANPDVLEACRAEARASSGGFAELPLLDAVVKETLRLNPVITEVGRRLTRPMRIGGRDIPAGVAVGPCIYLVHRRPDVWPDPERFDPARFVGTRPSPYEFLPFGGGARRCLGMAFALYEMKVVLATVLARAELAPMRGYRMKVVRRSITMAPSRGMPVVVTARAA